jgi:hypothetical protein
MMQIELTAEEAQNLLNLLDMVVRAQGLNAAQAALPLAVKVQAAMSDHTASEGN